MKPRRRSAGANRSQGGVPAPKRERIAPAAPSTATNEAPAGARRPLLKGYATKRLRPERCRKPPAATDGGTAPPIPIRRHVDQTMQPIPRDSGRSSSRISPSRPDLPEAAPRLAQPPPDPTRRPGAPPDTIHARARHPRGTRDRTPARPPLIRSSREHAPDAEGFTSATPRALRHVATLAVVGRHPAGPIKWVELRPPGAHGLAPPPPMIRCCCFDGRGAARDLREVAACFPARPGSEGPGRCLRPAAPGRRYRAAPLASA
jgi:hypothetical protein